jgi:hypothetical protein
MATRRRDAVLFACGVGFMLLFHLATPPSHPGDVHLITPTGVPPPQSVYNATPEHVDEPVRNCSFERNAFSGFTGPYHLRVHELRRLKFHHVRRLAKMVPRINNRTLVAQYQAEAGDDHYALLCYLAKTQRIGSIVSDVGSGPHGLSSLALGCNPHVPVFAYDVESTRTSLARIHRESEYRIQDQLTNIFLVHGDALSPRNSRVLLASAVILLSTHRDPDRVPFERAFVDFLRRNCFAGLLVVDGIHLNPGMEALWASIETPPRKYDVTLLGRPTGTGLVDFSGRLVLDGDM